MNFFQKFFVNFFQKGFAHFFQKCYINKLTVFLSLFCLRGVLPDEAFVVSGFFVAIGAGGGEDEEGGMFTAIVFNPDSKSLMSEGPFISGRIERAGACDCDCGSF